MEKEEHEQVLQPPHLVEPFDIEHGDARAHRQFIGAIDKPGVLAVTRVEAQHREQVAGKCTGFAIDLALHMLSKSHSGSP